MGCERVKSRKSFLLRGAGEAILWCQDHRHPASDIPEGTQRGRWGHGNQGFSQNTPDWEDSPDALGRAGKPVGSSTWGSRGSFHPRHPGPGLGESRASQQLFRECSLQAAEGGGAEIHGYDKQPLKMACVRWEGWHGGLWVFRVGDSWASVLPQQPKWGLQWPPALACSQGPKGDIQARSASVVEAKPVCLLKNRSRKGCS